MRTLGRTLGRNHMRTLGRTLGRNHMRTPEQATLLFFYILFVRI
jgi:hypothetical protein